MNSSSTLITLLLCGLMGLVGQGIRAAIGLKNSAALEVGKPGQQSRFNAAYFAVSMMIGFIAGVLAGLGLGIDALTTSIDMKTLLGIAAAGYAGADFIENAFSKIMPGVGASDGGTAAGQTTGVSTDPNVRALTAHVNTLANTVSALSNTLPVTSGASAPITTPGAVTQFPTLTPALQTVAPAVKVGIWVPPLVAALNKFQMTTNKRVAAAIGQFLVEAGAGFQEVIENLNYTHAERISEVFPTAFPTPADAAPYVGKPDALANLVYANRLGNGDQASGDGFRFRGRGLIQLTGRDEYSEFAAVIGMTADQASSYCETPEGAAMSGCWYLASRGCLLLADAWELSLITRRVNGNAMLGNSQRIAYSNAFLKALGG